MHPLMEPVLPKPGPTFVGEPGPVLSVARVLHGWQRADGLWFVNGQTQQSYPHARSAAGTACSYNDYVYWNGTPMVRVLSRGDVGPGAYVFDYGADKIWISDDPTGHMVEGAVSAHAFKGRPGANDVTVSGLVIEHFASPAQKGAIY